MGWDRDSILYGSAVGILAGLMAGVATRSIAVGLIIGVLWSVILIAILCFAGWYGSPVKDAHDDPPKP